MELFVKTMYKVIDWPLQHNTKTINLRFFWFSEVLIHCPFPRSLFRSVMCIKVIANILLSETPVSVFLLWFPNNDAATVFSISYIKQVFRIIINVQEIKQSLKINSSKRINKSECYVVNFLPLTVFKTWYYFL